MSCNQVLTYFRTVHGPEPRGLLSIFTKSDKRTQSYDLTIERADEEAAWYCLERGKQTDVYAAVGLQAQRPPAGLRGSEDTVASFSGTWVDVDIAGPAHSQVQLPSTYAAARSILADVGLRPSIIVRTPYGLHAYWLLKEVLIIDTERDRQLARSLSRRFQQSIVQIGRRRKYLLDTTHDLCRLLRVPGTFNHKIPSDIRPVTAEYTDSRYNISDFEEILEGVGDPWLVRPNVSVDTDLPPGDVDAISTYCAWFRHCADDAAILPEPEWYRMLTIISHCNDAAHHAHRLSRPYSRYTPMETNKKLQQAFRVGPVTCEYVGSNYDNGRYCAKCLFRGLVKSPMTISRYAREKW